MMMDLPKIKALIMRGTRLESLSRPRFWSPTLGDRSKIWTCTAIWRVGFSCGTRENSVAPSWARKINRNWEMKRRRNKRLNRGLKRKIWMILSRMIHKNFGKLRNALSLEILEACLTSHLNKLKSVTSRTWNSLKRRPWKDLKTIQSTLIAKGMMQPSPSQAFTRPAFWVQVSCIFQNVRFIVDPRISFSTNNRYNSMDQESKPLDKDEALKESKIKNPI